MKRILNLGCGNSFFGTDRIDLSKTVSTTEVLNIDKQDLPYDNETFDEVYAIQILEHLKNLDKFESEVFRVMKKGAKLKIWTDSATYIFWHVKDRWEHNNYLFHYYKEDAFGHKTNGDAHYHLFVKSHLKHLFKRFSKVESVYISHESNAILRFIANILPFNLGKRQIYCEVTK